MGGHLEEHLSDEDERGDGVDAPEAGRQARGRHLVRVRVRARARARARVRARVRVRVRARVGWASAAPRAVWARRAPG